MLPNFMLHSMKFNAQQRQLAVHRIDLLFVQSLLFVLHEKILDLEVFSFTWGLGSLYVICLYSYLDDFYYYF